jgi:transposase
VRTEPPPTKLNAEQLKILEQIVEANNDATLDELRYQLEQKTGVLIGRSTVDRMLTKLNLTVKKNTPPHGKGK